MTLAFKVTKKGRISGRMMLWSLLCCIYKILKIVGPSSALFGEKY